MIFGFGYKARSGKDTLATHLVDTYGFKRIGFADALKEGARQIFGLSDAQLYGDLKEVVDPFWGLTPRNILQRLGTESVRNVFGQETWIRALKRRIDNGGTCPWVVTDVRFPNEAKAIKAWGGYLVRIDRPGAGASGGVEAHPSETALDSFASWDAVIHNDGSLEDLYRKGDVLAKLWEIRDVAR